MNDHMVPDDGVKESESGAGEIDHVHLPPGGKAQVPVEVEDVQILTLDGYVQVRIRPGLSASLGTEEQGEMYVWAALEDLPHGGHELCGLFRHGCSLQQAARYPRTLLEG